MEKLEGAKAPFLMPEKLAIIAEGKSRKIVDLLVHRALDNNSCLPTMPSAQLWKSFTEDEKDELIDAVEKAGLTWSSYEKKMRLCWPKARKQ